MDGTEEPALASGASVDELVPGSVEQILGLADELSGLGDGLLDAANALSRVEVTGWCGAASDAAHGRLGQEPSRWSGASGAFTTAGEALRRYAAALAPARQRAAHAVEAYRRYLDLVQVLEVATAGTVPSTGGTTAVPGSGQLATSGPDRAELGRRAAVLVAADQGRTDPSAVAVLGPLGTDLSGLAHSADALRRQAVALLAEARAQVVGAGDVAADAVQAAMIDAPDSRTFWQGTIRKPGAEDAAHSTLDVAGFIPGWIGIGATLVNVGWYALEGDRENAGYAAMGVVPLGLGKVGKEVVAGTRVFTFGSKADLLKAEAEDLPGLADALGLRLVPGSTNVFESKAGLQHGLATGKKYPETHRITHVLAHCFPPDGLKDKHSIFIDDPRTVIQMIDDAWRTHPQALPDNSSAYDILMGRQIGTGEDETVLHLVVARLADGSDSVITAFPISIKESQWAAQ